MLTRGPLPIGNETPVVAADLATIALRYWRTSMSLHQPDSPKHHAIGDQATAELQAGCMGNPRSHEITSDPRDNRVIEPVG